MEFSVDSKVFEKLPALQVGILVVRGCDNASMPVEIVQLLRQAEASVRSTLSEDTFKQDPRLAVLQDAHRSFGSNPNKFPPSVQALAKRVLKGGQLPSINPLVDLYNVISLRYVLTAGGEDLDRTSGDIRLTVADGTENFVELGATEHSPPDLGEIVYRDDEGIICRKLNWREGERTKLTAGTKNAVLVIESLLSDPEVLPQALRDLKELTEKFCGGEIRQFILTAQNPNCPLR